jgi:hypothetical protein
MKSIDFFGYQIAANGRLSLPGLTPEETLEFESLSRLGRERYDTASEIRELELYLKRYKATAKPLPVMDVTPDQPWTISQQALPWRP